MTYNADILKNSFETQHSSSPEKEEKKTFAEVFSDIKEKIAEKAGEIKEKFYKMIGGNEHLVEEEMDEFDKLYSDLKNLNTENSNIVYQGINLDNLYGKLNFDNSVNEDISTTPSPWDASEVWDISGKGDLGSISTIAGKNEGIKQDIKWEKVEHADRTNSEKGVDYISTTESEEESNEWGINPQDYLKEWGEFLHKFDTWEDYKPVSKDSRLGVFGGVTKIGENLGSNDGGLYKDAAGYEYYVKFYEDPNQARVETVSNNIYEHLGIHAPRSEIGAIGNKTAYISRVIEGHERVGKENLKNSYSVRKGFVADAFLANWDVAGLGFDNLERGSDGRVYRIDNGGTLIFRAQGGLKEYGPDIPELESMLNPSINPNSALIFEGITEEEIKKQAQYLVDKLSEDDIRRIVSREDLPEETREHLINSMVGRRNFLINKFDLDTTNIEGRRNTMEKGGIDGFAKALEISELRRSLEKHGYVGVRGDSTHIEGHNINVVCTNKGDFLVYFKTTENHRRTTMITNEIQTASSNVPQVSHGYNYTFFNSNEVGDNVNFASLDIQITPNTVIHVAEDTEKKLAFKGAVQIAVRGGDMSPEQISTEIEKAMKTLGIDNGLEKPDTEAEMVYRFARYKWFHKISEMDEKNKEEADKLVLEEVFPGYSTYVNEKAVEEWTKDQNLVLAHSIYESDNITNMLKGGLQASQTRWESGKIINGLSTGEDTGTGGFNSAFTRLISEETAPKFNLSNYTLVINPEVLNRTDWYAYKEDNYGSIREDTFSLRPSADEFVNDAKINFYPSNEVMFKRGVHPNMIMGICTRLPENRMYLINEIRKELGVEEINGIPLEKFVVCAENMGEFFDIRNLNKKEVTTAE